jgi:CelD/BcsL family acetyltransferase involved in cellulose biosynthesis
MTTRKHSRLAALRARFKRLCSEIGYANHRMFDIRTGARFMKPHERSRRSATG